MYVKLVGACTDLVTAVAPGKEKARPREPEVMPNRYQILMS